MAKPDRINNGIAGLAYGIGLGAAVLGITSAFHYDSHVNELVALGTLLLVQLALIVFVYEFSKYRFRQEIQWIKRPLLLYLLLNGLALYVMDSILFDRTWSVEFGFMELTVSYIFVFICLIFWGFRRFKQNKS